MSVTYLGRGQAHAVYRLVTDSRKLLSSAGSAATRRHVASTLAALLGARLAGIATLVDPSQPSIAQFFVSARHALEGADDERDARRHLELALSTDPALRAILQQDRPLVTVRGQEVINDQPSPSERDVAPVPRAARVDHALYSRHLGAPGRARLIWLVRRGEDPPFTESDRSLLHLFHLEYAHLDPLGVASASGVFGRHDGASDGEAVHLAPREREVLALMMRGLTEKEIARDMQVSPHTVHHYVKRIYRHFNVRSRQELFARRVPLARARLP